jgi:tRNA dimethylallyltransferase
LYKLAAIVGPTAVGKTSIAIKVARELNGEIISCDSMQIYKGMDIGTAKASEEEQAKVGHHLIDIVEADRQFSVADYQKLAVKLIEKLNGENKLPILVGGTGLYYQSVVDSYVFFPMQSRDRVREKWNAIIKEKGLEAVYHYLQSIDPEYAEKISSNDQKRIVRALEVYELTGKTFSSHQMKKENAYDLAVVGLYLERQDLYSRIEQRVDKMLQDGLIEEVEYLREQGYDLSNNSMQALGYKQVYYYLQGFINKEEMIEEIKKETRRYAKRQYTWFKKDRRILWLNIKAFADDKLLAKKIVSYWKGVLYRA